MLSIQVRYGGKVPGTSSLTQREFNELKREAWRRVGRHWFEHMLPKHFTREGGREYQYAPRAGEPGNERPNFWRSYTGRKQLEMHHRLPLVYTGELRDRSKVCRIEATATSAKSQVRILLTGARKANLRNKHSEINMAAELTRISEAEAEELIAMYDDEVDKALRAN